MLRYAIFGLLGIGLLGFGAVAWISTWPSDPAPVAEAPKPADPIAQAAAPPPPAKIMVMVASRQLRAGTFLKTDDLRGQEFLVGQAPQGAMPDSPQARGQMGGVMVRHSLSEGQPVLADDVLRPGDHGFLATVLEPGMRAMTFNVADVTTDWALIWPGDHVDIILTQQFDDSATAQGRRIAAETIIHDARVVAVDRQLVQGETADDADHKGSRTLTVELSPSDSEHLVVAQRLGRITLALVSAAPPVAASLGQAQGAPVRLSDATAASGQDQITWGGDVAHALDQPPPPEPIVVRIFRGSEAGTEFKF